jgi:hypothetical protein
VLYLMLRPLVFDPIALNPVQVSRYNTAYFCEVSRDTFPTDSLESTSVQQTQQKMEIPGACVGVNFHVRGDNSMGALQSPRASKLICYFIPVQAESSGDTMLEYFRSNQVACCGYIARGEEGDKFDRTRREIIGRLKFSFMQPSFNTHTSPMQVADSKKPLAERDSHMCLFTFVYGSGGYGEAYLFTLSREGEASHREDHSRVISAR